MKQLAMILALPAALALATPAANAGNGGLAVSVHLGADLGGAHGFGLSATHHDSHYRHRAHRNYSHYNYRGHGLRGHRHDRFCPDFRPLKKLRRAHKRALRNAIHGQHYGYRYDRHNAYRFERHSHRNERRHNRHSHDGRKHSHRHEGHHGHRRDHGHSGGYRRHG